MNLNQDDAGAAFELVELNGYTVGANGDVLGPDGVTVVGHVIMPNAVGEGDFAETGRFYFRPEISRSAPGFPAANPGFTGEVDGSFFLDGLLREFVITVDPGYSSTGSSAVTIGDDTLSLLRVQQRLRYLGYPGFEGVPTYAFEGGTGDVIALDLAAIGGGVQFTGLEVGGVAAGSNTEFAVPGKGRVILSNAIDGQPFATTGRAYFLPDVPRATPGFPVAPASPGFTGDVVGHVTVDGLTHEIMIHVAGDFTGGPNSVTAGADKLSVYRVEQRLRYLGFPGFTGDTTATASLRAGDSLAVDGTLDHATRWAIGLFNAAVSSTPSEFNAAATEIDLTYANAANAPRWVNLEAQLPAGVRICAPIPPAPAVALECDPNPADPNTSQPEVWTTNWTLEVLAAAAGRSATDAELKLRAASLKRGGGFTAFHTSEPSGHVAGLDLDFETPASNSATDTSGSPFFRTITTGGIRYVAANPASPGTGPYIVRTGPDTFARGSDVDTALKVSDVWDVTNDDGKPDVLGAIRSLFDYASDYSAADVRGQIETFVGVATASGASVAEILSNDPNAWGDGTGSGDGTAGGGIVRFAPKHGGIFHVQVRPPAAVPAPAPSGTSTTNSADASMHSGGALDVTGALDAATQWAIGLFNAAVADSAAPHDAQATTIDAAYINAVNAPRWVHLVDNANQLPGVTIQASVDGQPQMADWATSWLVEVLIAAAAKSATDPDLVFRAASLKRGGDSPAEHAGEPGTHDAGRHLDLTNPSADESSCPTTLFAELTTPSGATADAPHCSPVAHVAVRRPDPVLEIAPELQGQILKSLSTALALTSSLADPALGVVPLPIVNQPATALIDTPGVLNDTVYAAVAGYFGGTPNPTTAGLVQAIQAAGAAMQAGPAPAATASSPVVVIEPQSVTGGFELSPDGGAIVFHLTVAATQQSAVPIDLASAGESLGLALLSAPTVNVTAGFTLDLGFGYDLAGGLDPADAAFVTVQDFHVTAATRTLASAATVGFDMNVGFLGDVAVQDAAIDLDVSLAVSIGNPDGDAAGRITLGELQGTTRDELLPRPTVAACTLAGALPAHAQLGTFSSDARLDLAVDSNCDLLITPDAAFEELLHFNNVNPNTVLAAFEQPRAWLGGVQNALATPIPFAQGVQLRDLIRLATLYDDRVAAQLEDPAERQGTPNFQTAQALETLLRQVLNDSSIRADYDADTHELTYENLMLRQQFDAVSAPVDFNLNLGSLAGLSTSARISVTPEATIGFNVGIDLAGAAGEKAAETARSVFLREAAITGRVSLAATDIAAQARLGFLCIETAHGSAGGTLDFGLSLGDGERVYLREAPPHATPAVSGSALVTLQQIGTCNNVAATQGNPTITITLPGTSDAAVPDVAFNSDMTRLLDYGQLQFDDITAALRGLADWLSTVTGFDVLDTKLPLLNRSTNDLLGLVDRLTSVVDTLERNPAASLNVLEEAIEDAFGLPDGANPDSPDIELSLGDRLLRIDVNLTPVSFARDLPINLDLDVFSLNATGRIAVNADVQLDVALGIDLTNPAAPKPFVFDTSRVTFAANAASPDLDFTAALGPLAVSIQNGTAALAATFDVALNSNGRTPGRHEFNELTTLDSLSFQPAGSITATLPLVLPTGPAGNIVVNLRNLADLENIAVIAPAEACPGGANGNCITLPDFKVGQFDLSVVLDGLDALLENLQNALDDRVFGVKLPLVGENLKDAARIIEGFRSDVLAEIRQQFAQAKDATALRAALFNAFGPAGLNILADLNSSGSVTADDVQLPVQTSDEVRVNLRLKQTLAETRIPLNADLGFPGLGLDLAGNVVVNMGYEFAFGFGVSRSAGFYFDTSRSNELRVTLDAGLELEGAGTFGFLQLDVAAPNPTRFAGSFTVDVTDPSRDGRLTLDEITSGDFGSVIDARFGAAADLNLQLTASVAGSTALPRIRSDFFAAWRFDRGNPDLSGQLTDIGFRNVGISLGEFLNGFARPVLEKIQAVIAPLDPILTILTEPLPVISELGDAVTLLDLADIFGVNDAADFLRAVSDLKRILDAIRGIQVGGEFITLGSFELDPSAVLRGEKSARLAPQSVRSEPGNYGAAGGVVGDADRSGFEFPILTDPKQAFRLLLGQDATLFTYDMPRLGFEFEYSQFFPIVGPLGARFTGRIGASADFGFGFDTSGIKTGDVFDGFFVSDRARADGTGDDVPELNLNGEITAAAELNVGLASGGVEGGIFPNVDFNLNDPNGDGKVRAGELIGLLQQGVECVFDIHARIDAGLNAYVKIGKGRLSKKKEYEIGSVTLYEKELHCDPAPGGGADQQPPQLAALDAGVLTLNMGPRAGLRFPSRPADDSRNQDRNETFAIAHVGGEPSFETVRVSAFGNDQEFAGVRKIVAQGGNGNDSITIGENVAADLELWGDEGTGEPGNDTIAVSGGGTIVLFGGGGRDNLTVGAPAAASVEAHGGPGNDTIVVQAAVPSSAELWGDEDTDNLRYQGQGSATLHGGSGTDQLRGGDGADQLFGDEDSDTVRGGAGDDVLDGGTGDDALDGEDDADTLRGDAGNDVLEGGDGADQLEGGTEDDDLSGDAGNDSLAGDAGSDTLSGGDGADQLDGGDDADELFGDAGADTLTGGEQNDRLEGGDGDDSVSGGRGNDSLAGDAGRDTLAGDDDADQIDGGSDADSIRGGAGSDVIDAGAGDDCVTGGSGDDQIDAGADDDTVDAGDGFDTAGGGAGDDRIDGGIGRDQLSGDAGDDTIAGGANADSLEGGSGHDSITGDAGPDTITGDAGDDTVAGGNDADQIDGGRGDDRLSGDAGSDVLAGGAGRDHIEGGDDADEIDGGSDDDFLDGGAGRDLITGGRGSETIVGGWGSDRIFAGTSASGGGSAGDLHVMFGDLACSASVPLAQAACAAGTAALQGGAAGTAAPQGDNHADEIFGDSGGDTVYAGVGGDSVLALAGADLIYGQDGDDVITAGAGSDTVVAGWGRDIVLAGTSESGGGAAGDVNLICGDAVCSAGILPADPTEAAGSAAPPTSDHADRLFGDVGNDAIFAGVGNDSITAVGGTDQIDAGDGNDLIRTTVARRASEGASRAPSVSAGSTPTRSASEGDKFITAGPGNDTIETGSGNDTIRGEAGDDLLIGGAGSDLIVGGPGRDVIYAGLSDTGGGSPNDRNQIFGDNDDGTQPAGSPLDHADRIWGDVGVDSIFGGPGGEIIEPRAAVELIGANALDTRAAQHAIQSGVFDRVWCRRPVCI